MATLNQTELNKAQDMLDELIKVALSQATECCNVQDGPNRDRYNMIASHLLAAKSVAGGLDAGGVKPRFGGK